MSKEIIEKTNILADAIAQSLELAELRSTEQKMNYDPEARKLIEEYQTLQMRMANLQEEGAELTDTDHKTMEHIDQQMENNEIIAAYLNAQDRFSEMLNSINSILASAIAGEQDGCSGCASSGCGDNGCGCSGC